MSSTTYKLCPRDAIHSKRQMVSIWLDVQRITLALALFFKDDDDVIYPIVAQTVGVPDADFWTPLERWIEDYTIDIVVVPSIEGISEDANRNLDEHPVARVLQQKDIDGQITIAKWWLPLMALSNISTLKRDGKLNLAFFETAAKIQELIEQRKFNDGRLMAYLQGFADDWDKPRSYIETFY